MGRELLIQFFIAAARQAARWPKPHRFEAREALFSLPAEHFEPHVAENEAPFRDYFATWRINWHPGCNRPAPGWEEGG
jgi:hypothetical protein